MLPDWLVPQWPAPAHVRALCTTRSGGMSAPPYNSLNLGTHVGDEAAHVLHNRAVLQGALGVRPIFLNQVHGYQMLVLEADTPDGLEADGCWTTGRDVACTVMVADCLPILLCDRAGTQVAAVHAGWRGLVGEAGVGVVEQVYKHFSALAPVEPAQAAPEIIAWLGPCIGPQTFEVGPEVRAAFVAAAPEAALAFVAQPGGKWLANLPMLARQRLQALGISVVYGNDGSPDWCTVSNPSRFFSHRRDRVSGRFAACIWLA
ncbi:peptidoglycan editing factor PgeF [Rhodoferax saidenbachensis]|uniref:Purine nucleoside phosphorylase n=1 Tax=Rhodoferax saidenbachensis TaxID=1484693 RepID=A0A1P8KFE7_9BURK|nr:peptidoglycan editing factor PgeF [Rhodoferax saidenbachensis]APW44777.1 laccase [Rhodoferax saidenbachensis]